MGAPPAGRARLARALERTGRELVESVSRDADLVVSQHTEQPAQGYRLELSPEGATCIAGDSAGASYGLTTLAQQVELAVDSGHPEELPALLIHDAPDFAERGVTIDVARDRRPTLGTLKDWVVRLADWKLNRLQLYMEADFAYKDCEEALADRSPYTTEELRELDAHCRAHHVELVPNQQSFGHLHAWLRHSRWRELAEVPEGLLHPFTRVEEPFSLAAVDPRSLEFVAGLYDQLLGAFGSEWLNVGLDETFDLGQGRSREACSERGTGRVYLEFLRGVHALAAERGKRIQFWGDIVLQHPDLIPELPADATAMVWGYEADFPFAERLPHFASSGLPFQVCPGTSSWNSFGGRHRNALGNLQNATREGLRHGARGILITDWGDRGHLQPYPTPLVGQALGAACAWNVEAGAQLDLEAAGPLLDRHLFEDPSGELSAAALALGTAGDVLGDACENGHALFFATTFAHQPFPHPRIVGVDAAGLARVREHLEQATAGLGRARSRRPDAQLLAQELELARELLQLGEATLRARLAVGHTHGLDELPQETRTDLRARLDTCIGQHRALWPRRFRPGGLDRSVAWLDFLNIR